MKTIHFNLTIEEANLLFKALGHMPFMEVYQLIGKLNDQANQQLQGTQKDVLMNGHQQKADNAG